MMQTKILSLCLLLAVCSGPATADRIRTVGTSASARLDGKDVRVELQQVTPKPRNPKAASVPYLRLVVLDAADRSKIVWSVKASNAKGDPFNFPLVGGVENVGDVDGKGVQELLMRVENPTGRPPALRLFSWQKGTFVFNRNVRLTEDPPHSNRYTFGDLTAREHAKTWVLVVCAIGPGQARTSAATDPKSSVEVPLGPREILATITSLDRGAAGGVGQAVLTPDGSGYKVKHWIHPLAHHEVAI